MKQRAGTNERNDNPGASNRQQKFAPTAVDQQDASNGHQEIYNREEHVSPMSLDIGKAGLQKNVGVVSNDGVDASGLITGKDDAGQHKRNDVLAAQKRLFYLGAGFRLLGRDGL